MEQWRGPSGHSIGGAWAAIAALLFGCGSDAELLPQSGKRDARDERAPVRGTPPPPLDAGLGRVRDGGAPPKANDPTSVVALSLEVEWTNCSLYTGVEIGERPPEADSDDSAAPPPRAKCATLELPLRWEEPDGPRLAWFVKKVPAAEPSRGQLWLLQGGPGSSGVGLEYLADELNRTVPDLDIYIPDHRGVGRSTLFECWGALRSGGTTEDQMSACGWELLREWGDDTAAFNTTSAARDVVAVATALRRPSEEVVIWGGSYGGYWAHRVLQVDQDDLVTAAVFDSAALPIGRQSTVYQTLKPHEAGDALLAACARDDECARRLGSDPRQRALEILDDLCPAFSHLGRGGRVGLQGLISGALREWRLLRLIPAILYRAERCDDADVAYLDGYAMEVFSVRESPATDVADSAALFLHIMYTEVVTELSELTAMIEASEGEVFSDLSMSVDLRNALADWPHYPPDEFVGRWAESDVPMLLLRGELDTQTPVSEGDALADQFTGDGQQAFHFPTGGHGVYYRTHDLTPDGGTSCGAHVTQQFLRHPTMPVDGSCVEDTPALDFAASEEVLLRIAGHTDVWDNPAE